MYHYKYAIALGSSKSNNLRSYVITIDGHLLYNLRWTSEDIRLQDQIMKVNDFDGNLVSSQTIRNLILDQFESYLLGEAHQTSEKWVFLSSEEKEEIMKIVKDTFDHPEKYGPATDSNALTNVDIADVIKSFLKNFEFRDSKMHIRVHHETRGFSEIKYVPVKYAFIRRFIDSRDRGWKLCVYEDIDWPKTKRNTPEDYEYPAVKVTFGRGMQDISLNDVFDFKHLEQWVRHADNAISYETLPSIPEYSDRILEFKIPEQHYTSAEKFGLIHSR